MLPVTKIKLQHQNPTIKDGSRLGLSFNAGQISYNGSIATISGIIPFILPKGVYKTSSILSNSTALAEFIRNVLLPQYQGLWPTQTNCSAIESKLKEYVTCAFSYHPEHLLSPINNLNDPKVALWILHCILVFTVDDLLDSIPSDSSQNPSYSNITNYMDYCTNYYNGIYKTVEELVKHNPIPVTTPTAEYRLKLVQLVQKVLPNYLQDNGHYLSSWKNGLRAWILLMESNPGVYSPNTKAVLAGYNGILQPNLEFTALLHDLKLPKEIRADVLFERITAAFRNASSLMNDIIGLSNGVRLGQTRDSSILQRVRTATTSGNVEVGVAFEDALAQLKWELADVVQLSNKLKECYKDELDLIKYLDFLAIGLDGLLYYYEKSVRFSSLNLEIVEIEQDRI